MSSALDPVRSVTGERDSAKAKREGKKKPPSKPSQSEEQKKKKKRRALRGSDDERARAKTQFHFRVRRQGQFSIVRAKIEKQNRSQRKKAASPAPRGAAASPTQKWLLRRTEVTSL